MEASTFRDSAVSRGDLLESVRFEGTIDFLSWRESVGSPNRIQIRSGVGSAALAMVHNMPFVESGQTTICRRQGPYNCPAVPDILVFGAELQRL